MGVSCERRSEEIEHEQELLDVGDDDDDDLSHNHLPNFNHVAITQVLDELERNKRKWI